MQQIFQILQNMLKTQTQTLLGFLLCAYLSFNNYNYS